MTECYDVDGVSGRKMKILRNCELWSLGDCLVNFGFSTFHDMISAQTFPSSQDNPQATINISPNAPHFCFGVRTIFRLLLSSPPAPSATERYHRHSDFAQQSLERRETVAIKTFSHIPFIPRYTLWFPWAVFMENFRRSRFLLFLIFWAAANAINSPYRAHFMQPADASKHLCELKVLRESCWAQCRTACCEVSFIFPRNEALDFAVSKPFAEGQLRGPLKRESYALFSVIQPEKGLTTW